MEGRYRLPVDKVESLAHLLVTASREMLHPLAATKGREETESTG